VIYINTASFLSGGGLHLLEEAISQQSMNFFRVYYQTIIVTTVTVTVTATATRKMILLLVLVIRSSMVMWKYTRTRKTITKYTITNKTIFSFLQGLALLTFLQVSLLQY